jgi:hypothetical protein
MALLKGLQQVRFVNKLPVVKCCRRVCTLQCDRVDAACQLAPYVHVTSSSEHKYNAIVSGNAEHCTLPSMLRIIRSRIRQFASVCSWWQVLRGIVSMSLSIETVQTGCRLLRDITVTAVVEPANKYTPHEAVSPTHCSV